MAHVLLVTADRDLSLVVDLCLARAGHDVEPTLPPSAVAARLAQPPPEAVVVEYAPTEGAGAALVADLRRHWPRCPVLLVAAGSAGIADATELGQLLELTRPAELLRRPVQAYELLRMLDLLIQSAPSRAA
jgi:DNA-binding NtrC family response regulator